MSDHASTAPNEKLARMLDVNKRQAEFYNSISRNDDIQEHRGYATHGRANALTRAWAALRYRQQQAFENSGVEERKSSFHKAWIEKKRGGKFLEIGCFRGTRSSWPLILNSGTYLGIDLSHEAIEVLNRRLASAGFAETARGSTEDFLLMRESERYDLIFAHGVLHHFQDPNILFAKIDRLLADRGVLLLTEPAAVNLAFRAARAAYRPFQTDAEWEWPFTAETISSLERYLKPLDGLGWGRLSMPFSLLVGVPFIQRLTNPIYLELLRREISSPWGLSTWKNATVTAAYAKRTASRNDKT